VTTRTRRYVSAPAGTYAAAVLADAPAEHQDAADLAAQARAPRAAAELAASFREPDLDEILSMPPSSALQFPEDEYAPFAEPPQDGAAGTERLAKLGLGASWARPALRRMILGAAAGAFSGAAVGLFLMALSRPEGLAAAFEPVNLWRSLNDQWKLMGALVTLAFALFGMALAARENAASLPDA
jgi:hypothetical protein